MFTICREYSSKASILKIHDTLDIQIEDPTIRSEVLHALDQIDKVHTVDGMPKISVVARPDLNGRGAFDYVQDGKPLSITVRPRHRILCHTMVHEVGHFLDYAGLGSASGFESEWQTNIAMVRVMTDIRASAGFQSIHQRTLRLAENTEAHFLLSELVSSAESFARAYSQWIAIRSNDSVLLEQLGTIMRLEASLNLGYNTQWLTEDFEPIGSGLDQLVRGMGWLKL